LTITIIQRTSKKKKDKKRKIKGRSEPSVRASVPPYPPDYRVSDRWIMASSDAERLKS